MHSTILPPRKWQEGFVYVRVKRLGIPGAKSVYATFNPLDGDEYSHVFAYEDATPAQRVIASSRVERAVENDGYMERCIKEGLTFEYRPYADHPYGPGPWRVHKLVEKGERDNTADVEYFYGDGRTLGEAYWRCHHRIEGTYGFSKKEVRKLHDRMKKLSSMRCFESIEVTDFEPQTPVKFGGRGL